MHERLSVEDRAIGSADELSVGDAIYSEGAEKPYWVTEIDETTVVLENSDGIPCSWRRETFEASLDTHTWIRQS